MTSSSTTESLPGYMMPDRHWLWKNRYIHKPLYDYLGGMSQDHWEYAITHLVLRNFMPAPEYVLEIGVFGGWTMMGWLELNNAIRKAVALDMWKRPTAPL